MAKGFAVGGLHLLVAPLLLGCGSAEPGEQILARWLYPPDAVVFGSSIHPLLSARCGTPRCHGRETTFTIHQADALAPGADLEHPSSLPEPLRTDYYTVLAFSDAEAAERSKFLVWGCGEEPAHPGIQVRFTAEERTRIIDWLENYP